MVRCAHALRAQPKSPPRPTLRRLPCPRDWRRLLCALRPGLNACEVPQRSCSETYGSQTQRGFVSSTIRKLTSTRPSYSQDDSKRLGRLDTHRFASLRFRRQSQETRHHQSEGSIVSRDCDHSCLRSRTILSLETPSAIITSDSSNHARHHCMGRRTAKVNTYMDAQGLEAVWSGSCFREWHSS